MYHYSNILGSDMNWLEYLGDGMPDMKDKLIALEKELPLFALGNNEIDIVEQTEPCCEERCTEQIEWKRAHDEFDIYSWLGIFLVICR